MDVFDSLKSGFVEDLPAAPVKAFFRGLSTVWARRQFSVAIERESGVSVRYQKLPKLLGSPSGQAYIRQRDVRQLAQLIQPAVDTRYSTREHMERVAECTIQFVRQNATPGLAASLAANDVGNEVKELIKLWAPRAAHHGPDEYLQQLRAPELLDRDEELDDLSHLMRWATGGYIALKAPPFAGKTALMSELAAEPPDDVDVISFFIRRSAGRNRANDFLESVNRQLKVLINEVVEPGGDLSGRRADFERLWSAATRRASCERRVIALLVDGLDEQQTDDEVAISQLLPAMVGADEVIFISTRPNPLKFPGVDVDHAARLALEAPVKIEASPHAGQIRARAEAEIEVLLARPDGLPARCFGLLVALCIPTNVNDLAEVLDEPQHAVRMAIRTFENLTLGSGAPSVPWVLAHDTFADAAKGFGSDWRTERRNELRRWADSYRRRRWPAATPSLLTRHYWSLFRSTSGEDLAELHRLVADGRYLRRACGRSGGRKSVLELADAVLLSANDSEHPAQFASAIASALVARAHCKSLLSATPSGATQALSNFGRWSEVIDLLEEPLPDRATINRIRELSHVEAPPVVVDTALQVAASLASPRNRIEALAIILKSHSAIEPGRLSSIFLRAEEDTKSILDPAVRSEALEWVASMATVVEPARACELLDQALVVAKAIQDSFYRSGRLGAVATSIAINDPSNSGLIDWAIEVVERVHDVNHQEESFARIASALIRCGPVDLGLATRALTIVERIYDSEVGSEAMLGLVTTIAGQDPGNSELIEWAVLVAGRIPEMRFRAEALASLAATFGELDSDRAIVLLDRVLEIVEGMKVGWYRRIALRSAVSAIVTLGLNESELMDHAMKSAQSITPESSRSDALLVLSSAVAVHDTEGALGLVGRALDPLARCFDLFRTEALLKVASTIAVRDSAAASALVESTFNLAAGITEEWEQRASLLCVASVIAVHDFERGSFVVDQALRPLVKIGDPASRSEALVTIAMTVVEANPEWAWSLVERAVGIASAIPTPASRSEALAKVAAAIAKHDAEESSALVDRAVFAAEGVRDPVRRCLALLRVASALSVHDSGRASALADHALQAPDGICNPASRTEALIIAASGREVSTRSEALVIAAAATVRHDAKGAAGLLDRGVEIAEAVPDPLGQMSALKAVASSIAEHNPDDSRLVRRAIGIAEDIPDPKARQRALMNVASTIGEHDAERALELLRSVQETVDGASYTGSANMLRVRIQVAITGGATDEAWRLLSGSNLKGERDLAKWLTCTSSEGVNECTKFAQLLSDLG